MLTDDQKNAIITKLTESGWEPSDDPYGKNVLGRATRRGYEFAVRSISVTSNEITLAERIPVWRDGQEYTQMVPAVINVLDPIWAEALDIIKAETA